MSDKYVAYLDILGFKNWLNDNDIFQANIYLKKYSESFHKVWEKEDTIGLSCYMVSDCAVIHTEDLDKEKLNKLLKVIIEISKSLFMDTGILIRGAVSKGNFENITNGKQENDIVENIFTGNAYVDAFLLEEKPKVAGIALSTEVVKDTNNYLEEIEIVKLKDFSLVKYFTYDFFTNENNLDKFINLAVKAKWLPHYHNTIYCVLYNDSSHKALFGKIIDKLEELDSKGELTKKFITTSFEAEIDENYIKQFTTFLRSKIVDSKINN